MLNRRSILLTTLAFALSAACEGERHVRVYDEYRGDYHPWDDREEGYYRQWERETHHEDRDYHRRNADEQRQYWQWRHQRHEEH